LKIVSILSQGKLNDIWHLDWTYVKLINKDVA